MEEKRILAMKTLVKKETKRYKKKNKKHKKAKSFAPANATADVVEKNIFNAIRRSRHNHQLEQIKHAVEVNEILSEDAKMSLLFEVEMGFSLLERCGKARLNARQRQETYGRYWGPNKTDF